MYLNFKGAWDRTRLQYTNANIAYRTKRPIFLPDPSSRTKQRRPENKERNLNRHR